MELGIVKVRIGQRYRLKEHEAKELLWNNDVIARDLLWGGGVIVQLGEGGEAVRVRADDLEPVDVRSELELLRQIADDIAATRKAIESLALRWGGGDWRTGPR